ncbi:MAG: hypothetical protein OHK0023_12600 [Anaerolineae bacterium]
MQPYHVRWAIESDLLPLKVAADANRDSIGFIMSARLQEAIRARRIFVAVARDGRLIGFVIFRHRKADLQTTLSEICVNQEWRRQGVGCALLKQLYEVCQILNRSHILLRCPADSAANHFYKRLGFIQIGLESGKRRPIIVWRLPISAKEDSPSTP